MIRSQLVIAGQRVVVKSMSVPVFEPCSRNVENTKHNTRLGFATPTTSTKIHHMRLFLVRHAETVSMSNQFDGPNDL